MCSYRISSYNRLVFLGWSISLPLRVLEHIRWFFTDFETEPIYPRPDFGSFRLKDSTLSPPTFPSTNWVVTLRLKPVGRSLLPQLVCRLISLWSTLYSVYSNNSGTKVFTPLRGHYLGRLISNRTSPRVWSLQQSVNFTDLLVPSRHSSVPPGLGRRRFWVLFSVLFGLGDTPHFTPHFICPVTVETTTSSTDK